MKIPGRLRSLSTACALAVIALLATATPAAAEDILTTNGGFESPGSAAVEYRQLDESLVSGWVTSAADDLIEIWSNGFNGVTPYAGNQLAEINATSDAILSQSLTTEQSGAVHQVAFAHRGRAGTDTMRVQYRVGAVVTTIATVATGNSAWVFYTLTFTPGASAFQIEFESVSTAAGNQSVGNFLDAVTVTNPEPGSIAFMALGLLGLGGLVRRRRALRAANSATA